MSLIKISLITSLLVLLIACGSDPAPASASVDIEATVEARVAKELGRATPTPKPLTNVEKAVATATPTPMPTFADLPAYEGSPMKTSEIMPRLFRGGKLIVKVVRVIDGDTIEVDPISDRSKLYISPGTRVRYLDIDTPETVHPDKPVQCYGPEATLRNKQLVEGKEVAIGRYNPETPITDSRDQYGRILAYVFTDEYFVNGELVWGGFAYDYKGKSGAWWEMYFEAWELDAKNNARGLWSKCHNLTPQPTPVPTVTSVPTPRPTATPRPIPTATPRPIPTATKNAYDFNLEGNKFFNAKDYSRAIESYTKAIALSKDYTAFDRAIFYYHRGNSEYNLFNYVAAINDFSLAIQLNPNNENYFLMKGYSYHFLKQYEKAVNDYNKVLEINPNNTGAITNKKAAMEQIRLRARPTATPRPTATATPRPTATATPRPVPTATPRPRPTATPKATPTTFDSSTASQSRIEAKKQYDAGDYSGAIENYTKVIQISPIADDYYYRGLSYYNLELYELALNDLNQTIALNPDYLAYNLRGIVYEELGLNQKALDDYTKAIEMQESEIFLANRGMLYNNLKEYQKALDDFNKSIELNPDYYSPYFERIQTNHQLKQYEESILDGLKIIQLDPDNDKDNHDYAYAWMGYSRYKLGQYQQALDNFNKVLELDPSWEENLRQWINDAKAELNK
tara:strand:- start:884 stop:2929 length:2046 start_codon:yes stop_codon:yes gene_type:complete